ncbi:MAG: hypothetical protein J0L92_40800, partial [Deltaproteobacteria bacterium]|nr:hypothetical protein [Deltaproteobacteria bacterium]
MRRPALLASLGIVLAVSTARPMDAQTCTRPACIGPFATPDALSSAALREARARSWRMAHRAGAA